ncbi:hypothetical protein ACLESO_39655 [Pyxidicoccus sp. 3LG]
MDSSIPSTAMPASSRRRATSEPPSTASAGPSAAMAPCAKRSRWKKKPPAA